MLSGHQMLAYINVWLGCGTYESTVHLLPGTEHHQGMLFE